MWMGERGVGGGGGGRGTGGGWGRGPGHRNAAAVRLKKINAPKRSVLGKKRTCRTIGNIEFLHTSSHHAKKVNQTRVELLAPSKLLVTQFSWPEYS